MLRILFSLALLASLTGRAADDYVASINSWHAQRVTRLTAPDSWLTLIGRHPLPRGRFVVGTDAGCDIRLAAGPARLGVVTHSEDGRVAMELAEGVAATIDGTGGRSAELVYTGEKPTFVRFGTANFYVLQRGKDLFLRVRDSESERRRKFAGIERFPVDPSWRIEAEWVPFDPPRQIPITNVLGQTNPMTAPGKAVFTRDGRKLELIPILEEPGEPLFFIIADETSGLETYGASRFLYADQPKDGRIMLDFNQAYNPPCAFTPFATCPLPPKENHLPIRVTAGEKAYAGLH